MKNNETFVVLSGDNRDTIAICEKTFVVLLCCGNGDTVTIYESANEADARARYTEEVARAGDPVAVTEWPDNDQEWRRLCQFELGRIARDEGGDIVDIETLEMSGYFWRD